MEEALAIDGPQTRQGFQRGPADDRAAFDQLYRESRDDLYAYVAYLVGDRSLAEDVTAEAFEKAFRKRRGFVAARGDRRAWLFGIARNAALDELRRRKRVALLDFDMADAAAADALEATVDRAHVSACLAGLTPAAREIVSLKFFAALTNQEIARIVGLSESNVGTKLHRSVQKLREAFHDR